MRVLQMPDDLAKKCISIRDSYDSAMQTLMVPLIDLPIEDRRDFYTNAFKDLCGSAIANNDVEMEIFNTFNISSFEKIDVDKIYTLEEEHDN